MEKKEGKENESPKGHNKTENESHKQLKSYEHVARKHVRKRKTTTINGWAIAALIFMGLFVVQWLWSPFPTIKFSGVQSNLIKGEEKTTTSEEGAFGGKTKVLSMNLYIMSKCPFGTLAVEELHKAVKRIGKYLSYNIEFIGDVGADGSLSSLHGDSEVKGDIIEVCAKKYYPDSYLDFIACMSKDRADIPNNWEDCAKQQGYDVEKLSQCYNGDEGRKLLQESFKKASEAGASASPTYIINGSQYVGAKREMDIVRMVCNRFDNNTKPEECQGLPACTSNADCNAKPNMVGICENPGTKDARCVYKEPSTVNMIVLEDKRCGAKCNIEPLISQLKTLLLKTNITRYDYSSKEGKALYTETGVKFLPAILFDDTLNESQAYDRLKRYLDKAGNYYSLRIGASFDPTKEICDNGIDDTGNGLVDCEDPDCKGNYLCMEKRDVPDVDLYVMSYCPFGLMAEKGILPVVDLLKDKINFSVKFVNYAMHGEKEVDENMAQYCIEKEQPDKYLDYLRCFIGTKSGAKDEIEKCREKTGINETLLKQCLNETEEKYGIKKAYNDRSTWLNGAFPIFPIYDEECKKYGVTGSPTLVINDVKIPSFERSPKALLDIICRAFKEKPKECDANLNSTTPAPGFGWSGSSGGAAASANCG